MNICIDKDKDKHFISDFNSGQKLLIQWLTNLHSANYKTPGKTRDLIRGIKVRVYVTKTKAGLTEYCRSLDKA